MVVLLARAVVSWKIATVSFEVLSRECLLFAPADFSEGKGLVPGDRYLLGLFLNQPFLIFFSKPSSSYCSPRHFFPRFPSFSVADLSVFGGAGFLVNFSFDCYPFEVAERPWRRSRKLLVSGRVSGNQAGPSGSSAGRSPRP
ncbi:hypothetical protein F511_32444 [Dorcoceras hygrometricum]|uniref:Uncharacterized protein n=1 Tax=Dorcoceras hygrometricum TaxID=472368 RepID=A0A2Z7BFY3_9LAMI|nr:hypothetical protein F511_32444 [Dorcoceras hygrometricum]